VLVFFPVLFVGGVLIFLSTLLALWMKSSGMDTGRRAKKSGAGIKGAFGGFFDFCKVAAGWGVEVVWIF
jgi:hypothetical protein